MKEYNKISAHQIPFFAYLKSVFKSRQLIVMFALRDIKIKYSQTLLGIAWSALQPLAGLIIFTTFFDYLIELPDLGYPYSIFAMTGMMGWYFFSYNVYQGGMSLSSAQDIIQKINFPKLVLPLSKVLVALTEFLIALMLVLLLIIAMRENISWRIIFLPAFLVINIIVSLSVSLWLSALTIRHRDLQHIVPYLINFGIWFTPVFYPTVLIPETYRWLHYINPMAGVVQGYRWSFIEVAQYSPYYLVGFSLSLIFFILGVWYFKLVDSKISDFL